MAMAAQDGSVHHSASRARLHDEISARKGAATETPAKGATPAPTKTPIEEHVGLHGPAHEIHYHHDQATGKHHVTSHHGEGEGGHHHSVHKSHEEAHAHMGKAMGVAGENEQEETPDMEEEYGGGESSGSMPGVSEA
jgi:hypothetical protein